MAPSRRSLFCLLLVGCALAPVLAEESSDADDVVIEDELAEDELKTVRQDGIYKSPEPSGLAYLAEHFDQKEHFDQAWVQSQAKKEGIDEDIAKYNGNFFNSML